MHEAPSLFFLTLTFKVLVSSLLLVNRKSSSFGEPYNTNLYLLYIYLSYNYIYEYADYIMEERAVRKGAASLFPRCRTAYASSLWLTLGILKDMRKGRVP